MLLEVLFLMLLSTQFSESASVFLGENKDNFGEQQDWASPGSKGAFLHQRIDM